ncbi:MAG: DUF1189 domain-containing protein [Ruminiclostridium sp.]|nr:DUF1189 domain-containing protein [Ruminiclostridium sp.]
MNEPRLNFFTKIYYSISGFENYRFFVMQKTGRAVVYLLLLSLIIGLIGIIQPVIESNKMINQMIEGLERDVPDFTFENGNLDVKAKMPLIIDEGGLTIIIDTSGATDESILDSYNNALLILQNKMIQKNYANQRVTDFTVLQGFKIDKSDVRNMLPLVKWFILFLFIILPPFIIAGRFLNALFVSIIGLIINSVKNTNLPYRDIFAISAHSLTLPLILGTILDFAGVHFLLSTLVYYLISAIYIWGAIGSIKRHSGIPQIPPAN